MKACVHGHPWTPENRRPLRKRSGSVCRPCEAARKRAFKIKKAAGWTPGPESKGPRSECMRGHKRTPENIYRDYRGKIRCKVCRHEDYYRQTPDGWEDEFGPVPARVSNRVWVDRVVLMRYLKDENLGRELTTGEVRALHLLNVMRGTKA